MNEELNNCVKLCNKPFEEMEYLELVAELFAHRYHRTQMNRCIEKLKTRLWWLEENKPILSKEEINQQYENGEITFNQYKTAYARRKKRIDTTMRMQDYMTLCKRIVFAEEAVIAYVAELMEEAKAREAEEKQKNKPRRKGRKPGPKTYDPRKRISKNNPPPKQLDPQRKWATRTEPKPLPKLAKARRRKKPKAGAKDSGMAVSRRLQPVVQWDVTKLEQIARDRGFYTRAALVAVIAERLDTTINCVSHLLNIGKLSWSQCILIGALFEMTPKEFCDVFLSGYFREVADGVFRAYVEDPTALLDAPYLPRTRGDASDAK